MEFQSQLISQISQSRDTDILKQPKDIWLNLFSANKSHLKSAKVVRFCLKYSFGPLIVNQNFNQKFNEKL